MNDLIFDNAKARKGFEMLITHRGGLPSGKAAKAILVEADMNWDGCIASAIAEAQDGNIRTPLMKAWLIADFANQLPKTYGYRRMTAEEIAAMEARIANSQANLATVPVPVKAKPIVQSNGDYRPSTGDRLADARNWAEDAYRCGDSWSDE